MTQEEPEDYIEKFLRQLRRERESRKPSELIKKIVEEIKKKREVKDNEG